MLKKFMSIFCIFLLLFSLVPIKTYAFSPTEMGEMEKYIYYLEQEFGCKDNSNIKYIKDLVESSPELLTVSSVAKTVVCSHPYVALAIAGVTVASGIYYYNKDSINSYVSNIYNRLTNKGFKFTDDGVLTGEQISAINSLIEEDKNKPFYEYKISSGSYVLVIPLSSCKYTVDKFGNPVRATVGFLPPFSKVSDHCFDECVTLIFDSKPSPGDSFLDIIAHRQSGRSCMIYAKAVNKDCFELFYNIYKPTGFSVLNNKKVGGISFKNYNSSPFKNVQPKKTYNFVPNKEKVPSLDNFVGLEVQPKTSTEPGTSTVPGASTDSSTSTDSKNLEIPDKVELDFSPLKLNLKDKFPFCVPYDLINLVRSFVSVERRVPEFNVTFPGILGTKEVTIKLSFKDFVHVAQLLRYFILIAFVCGLIKISRDMIRG